MTEDQTETVSAEEVRRLCGDVPDWKVTAILDTGADIAAIQTAVAWFAGEDDVMGEERRPLAGDAAVVYDILIADEAYGVEARGL